MSDPPRRRWIVPEEPSPPEWLDLSRLLPVPGSILSVLWRRGFREAQTVERFLQPSLDDLHDPLLLTDCDRAVDRVLRALADRETIFVFGDYDVDGITAATLWTRLLRHLGAKVHVTVPNRMRDGYGLSPNAIAAATEVGATLLIANDCGTTAHEAITLANAAGIDVVVVDHHRPEASLPPAVALVNPHREGDRYPFRDLCAVGVAFKILQAVTARLGDVEAQRFLFNHLDLVAIGSVADVVPLRGENRIFAHYGMKVLRLRPRPGITALLLAAGLSDKRLESSHIAFQIAPRLNAAGRLGRPESALRLLLAEDMDEARLAADLLERDNFERRRLHETVLAEALEGVDGAIVALSQRREAIVLGGTNWHPGVVGIAAARLVERFGVPVILVALGEEIGRGSGRTPSGVDLHALVGGAARHLSAWGGHKQAVGLSLAPADFPAFRDDLLAQSRVVLAAGIPAAALQLDGTLELRACDLAFAQWIERLGPFGEGNPEPLFYARGFCPSTRVLKERHLRFDILDGGRTLEGIGFGLADRGTDLPTGGAWLQLAFTPTVNRWRGQERVQLKVREVDFV